MSTPLAQLRIPRSANPIPTTPRLQHRALPIPLYALGALALITGLLVLSTQLGWFVTSGKVDGTGNRITLTSSSSGADLKGWMTIQQVLDAFGVSKQEFYGAFGLPSDLATDEKLGPLGESVPGFALEDVRTWLDVRSTLPTAVTPEVVATAVASTSTSVGNSASSAPSATHTPSGTPSSTGTPTEEPARDGTGSGSTTFRVRGSTSLDELVAATNVSRATLLTLFGIPESADGAIALEDLAANGVPGVSVDAVKDWANSL